MRSTGVSVVWGMALSALGCSGNAGDTPPPVTPPQQCSPGEWLRDDGACIPAGLPPDMPCPPGEWLRDDGACIPAGVPPDGCGQGFVHDGDRGCEPILPAEVCPPGFMAVPGEMVCREVAPCAGGKWGDIPVEPNTQYVDASYSGNGSDGSALTPWTSIQAAVDAADPGAIIAVAAGSYLEDLIVNGKAVRVWGVCPTLVELVGSAAGFAAMEIWPAAAGTEVHDLAIRGDNKGVWCGALDVRLERVWLHDTADWAVQSDLGSFVLADSLVERSGEIGVFASGSNVTVDASVVRDVALNAQGLFGRGIHARAEMTSGTPSTLRLQGSLVERNHQVGVYISGSDASVATSVIRDTDVDGQGSAGNGVAVRSSPDTGAPSTLLLETSLVERSHEAGASIIGSEMTLDASVVRNTQPNGEGMFGRGVTAQSNDMGAPATLLLRTSLVEQNHEQGVFLGGSEATVEASVVRGTQPEAQHDAGGVTAVPDPMNGAPTTLLLRASLVEDNHWSGVTIAGSNATMEATLVRDTGLDARGVGGIGVTVRPSYETSSPATLLARTSLIERNHELGLFVVGSQATIEASVIRDTQPNAQGLGGRGSNVQAFEGLPATVVLRGLLVEHSQELGVAIVGSAATIESCIVRDTSSGSGALFGDAVIVTAELGPASATIVDTRIEQSARAAISAHGAHVAVGRSALICQAFDIDFEALGQEAQIVNLEGNLCGCPEATETCKAVSAGLAPPPAPDPPPPPDD